ncbi:nicastrin [Glossina fuscipes fuscipes]
MYRTIYRLTVLLTILTQAIKIKRVYGERLRDKIYVPINGASCFRRLNGTHQVGCTSTQSGSVGALHLIEEKSDFDFLLRSLSAPPYAPMIPPYLFSRENIMRLKNEGGRNISVVLLIDSNTDKMTNFSHELQCPNQYSGIFLPNSNSTESPTCGANNQEGTWNPWGTGLLYEDLPFPVYYVPDQDEIKKLIKCFEDFNNFDYASHSRRSLCAIEVNTFMSAAVSTEVCMRRTKFINNLGRTRYCDPLEGKNVFATLFPRKIENRLDYAANQEKYIMVTCRLDSTSMFELTGLGAMDSLMGFGTLVSVAHMLKLLLPDQSTLKNRQLNVMFVILNGESYDYIGSQKLVFDLENLAFPPRYTRNAPIAFDNIEFVLDLNTFDEISSIRLHSISEFPQAKELLSKLKRYGSRKEYDFNIEFNSSLGYEMPPSSIQSFLRKNTSFPACVLNAPPTNRYYHSIYDDEVNIKFHYANTSRDYTQLMSIDEAFRYFPADSVQMKIRNISSVVAMALYEMLTYENYTSNKLANPLLIDEFLYCFTMSADCPLFKAASKPNSLPALQIPPNRYISVAGSPQESTGWTYRILGYLLSNKLENISESKCNYLPRHWFAGFDGKGECRFTTQNYSLALSPAFIIEDYNWTSGEYSTWTESTWAPFSARMFLRPSRLHETITFSIGCVVLVISFCLIYIISTRAEVLFEDTGPGASTDALAPPTAC